MFITGHTAVGVFVGLHTSNPLLGFVAGVGSHLLFDFIPHGDRKLVRTKYNPARGVYEAADIHERNKFLIIAAVDNVLAVIVLLVMSRWVDVFSLPVLLAVVGAVLPDVVAGLTSFARSRLMDGFTWIHYRIHLALPFDFSLRVGLLYQTIATIAFWWLSLRAS